MPFFSLTPSSPRPDPKTHPALLEGLRKVVAQARIEGRSDAEIRRQLLDELRSAVPDDAARQRGWQVLEGDWQQVADAILGERP